MRADDFMDRAAGRIVYGPTGYAAFVPAALPPEIRYDNDLVMALSRADTAISELAGLGRNLPNPHLLISPYMRREAVLSSRIEGTHTTLSGLLLDEIDEDASHSADLDLQEVRNYIVALNHGIAYMDTLSLSLRMIRELHLRLMAGVRGQKQMPGEFREIQNCVGPSGSTEFTAPYVPPPPEFLDDCLRNWEWFAHQRDTMPTLIQCAVLHEQFEAIHPFRDGNGRLGRLLIILFLAERARLPQPLLYPSAYIEAHKDAYYDSLQRVRTIGDWNGWIHFFLKAITESASESLNQARQLMDLRERYRQKMRENSNAMVLVDALFHNPFITYPRAMRELNVTNATARRAVQALAEAEIVEKLAERRYTQAFACRPILRILSPEE